MKNKNALIKTIALFSLLSVILFPISAVDANSSVSTGVTASVVQPRGGLITINSITATKTSGVADGTFSNGWKWTFDITIPNTNETWLRMNFSNWTSLGSGVLNIPIANNLKFYSEQSSNAFDSNNAILITSASTDSGVMKLTGNINNSPTSTRRVRITTETKIPTGSSIGSYSVNFSIKTIPVPPI